MKQIPFFYSINLSYMWKLSSGFEICRINGPSSKFFFIKNIFQIWKYFQFKIREQMYETDNIWMLRHFTMTNQTVFAAFSFAGSGSCILISTGNIWTNCYSSSIIPCSIKWYDLYLPRYICWHTIHTWLDLQSFKHHIK